MIPFFKIRKIKKRYRSVFVSLWGGGGWGGGGGGVTSYIWYSMDVHAEWPSVSALPSI